MKIYLNAGHDRQLDSGAVNQRLNIRECDEAYTLSLLVQQYLEHNGMAVLFGQNDDLYAVCDEANAAECDLFVSIHFNAFNGDLDFRLNGQLDAGTLCPVQPKSRPQPAESGPERTAESFCTSQYDDACRSRRSLLYRQ